MQKEEKEFKFYVLQGILLIVCILLKYKNTSNLYENYVKRIENYLNRLNGD